MAKACYSLAAVVFCLCVGKELVDGARRDPEFQSRLRVMDIDETDLKQLLGTKFRLGCNPPSKGISNHFSRDINEKFWGRRSWIF